MERFFVLTEDWSRLRIESGDRLRLLIGDRSVEVPARIAAAVDVVRDREALTPTDLGLDAASNLVLARRLVREGLLEDRQ